MKIGGIVLCGGKSARMGRAKGWLPFGGELLLQRVVRVVREATDEVVVVAGAGQEVPPLPAWVRVVRDADGGRGPLAGLHAGLLALAGSCEVAYLSACDAPFLAPAFVRRVVGCLEGGCSAAVPSAGGFWHPLAAAYRAEVLPTVREMLAANELRMTELLARVPTCLINPLEFADIDPELKSLRNVNTPDEYEAALRELAAS